MTTRHVTTYCFVCAVVLRRQGLGWVHAEGFGSVEPADLDADHVPDPDPGGTRLT